MRHHHQLNYRERRKATHRIRFVIILLMVAILVGVGYFLYLNFRASNFNSDEDTTSAPTTSYIAPNIKVLRTPYFQFQTNNSWTEDQGNTSDTVYSYRSLRGNLLEHTMTIYVNAAPTNTAVSRVLQTTLNGNRGLTAGKLSEQCGVAAKNRSSSFPTTLEGVSFRCFGDDTRYTVMVGLSGGTTNISLPRPDGSTASYTILYSNVTTTPDANQLVDIVNSFQTR